MVNASILQSLNWSLDTTRSDHKGLKMDKKSKKAYIASLKDEVKNLHPILEDLFLKIPGIIRVEYTHGKYEMGADFILYRQDDLFQSIEYIGVIAKIGKITQSARSYDDIVRQIKECFIPRLTEDGRDEIVLSEIWIIATMHITENVKKRINHEFAASKIKFVTGSKLCDWIDKWLNLFWEEIPLKMAIYLQGLMDKTKEIERSYTLIPSLPEDFYINQNIFKKEDTRKLKKESFYKKIVDIYDQIESYKILVIEGSMGIGKSKLIRQLIYYYCDPKIFKQKKYLPILLMYHELIDDYKCDIDAVITDKISETIIKYLPDNSIFLLFIDGIDEKRLSIDEHVSLFTEIIEKINSRQDCKAVFTTRDFSYFEAETSISNKTNLYEIAPLSPNSLIKFIEQICDSLNLTRRLINDIQNSNLLKNMPRSPIAAILLARLLNENSKDLPANIPELYSKYLELALGRWDIEKGLQSQKEYEITDSIIKNFAQYVIDNELHYVSTDEVKTFFREYCDKRKHLRIEPLSLFEKVIDRSGVIIQDNTGKRICFKHRTFAEYFHAKKMAENKSLEINNGIFQPYWFNVYYFYVGILKDCTDILNEIIELEPGNEMIRWSRMINMPNLLLSASLTPYDTIKKHVCTLIKEGARLYYDISSKNIKSPFSSWPQAPLVMLFLLVLRDSYSYEFFRDSIESAFIDCYEGKNRKYEVYELFFISMIGIELGRSDLLDDFINRFKNTLPFPFQFIIQYEGEKFENKSKILKKQIRNFKKNMKKDSQRKNIMNKLLNEPIQQK